MPLPLDARQLLRDSLPVAAILALWTVLDVFFRVVFRFGGGLRWAGVVMALLYVVVRGVQRGRRVSAPPPTDVAGHVEENVRVLLATGAWFLLAGVAAPLSIGTGLPVEVGGFVLATTGVLTVVLYAVAVGRARIATGGRPSGSGLRADD